MDSERTDRPDRQGELQAALTARALSPQIVAIMTTEHYNLQSGRAMTVSEANGRASLFLGTVSTSLIALAFVAQISRSGVSLGQAFYVFALVLLPSLMFLGLVTFDRVLQSGIEDVMYARGINRIRHLYQEHAPEMRPYFVLSSHDDDVGVMGNMAMNTGWWQTFITMAGMIAVINSILAGAFVGLLLAAVFNLTLGLALAVAIVVFLASVALYQRQQSQRWRNGVATLGVRFPTVPNE